MINTNGGKPRKYFKNLNIYMSTIYKILNYIYILNTYWVTNKNTAQ